MKNEDKINKIIEIVCKYYRIDVNSIALRSRKTEIREPRQVIHYKCKKLFNDGISLSNIGRIAGNKDHTTVLHSIKTIAKDSESNKIFKSKIESIENRCKLALNIYKEDKSITDELKDVIYMSNKVNMHIKLREIINNIENYK